MTRISSCAAVAILLLCAVSYPARADAKAYLPKLGPVPLRFQSPPNLGAPAFELPPLIIPIEPSAPDFTQTNTLSSAAPPAANGTSTTLPPPITTPPRASTHTSTNALAATPGTPIPAPAPPSEFPPGQNDLLAPQMLLQFFRRGTNTASGVILSPGFTPPPANAAASSSATYSTSP